MPNEVKIVIDPSSRILYASYYVKGLYEIFGKKSVSFSAKYFKDLQRYSGQYTFEHYFAYVVIAADKSITKIVIDFCDPPDINVKAYEWCDRYAKVNYNVTLTDKRFTEKIVSIPPGFGIRIWNKWDTFYYSLSNLVKCRLLPLVSFRRFFQDYYLQYKRPGLQAYLDVKSYDAEQVHSKPYVYMIATLWEANGEETNLQRKRFVERCKDLGYNFEGGFFASPDHPKYGEYKKFILSQRYSAKSYLQKTKRSKIVFNTPAVHNCHGWKLGEYLAMGKAILSTPLSNNLPGNIEHAKNIHIVSNTSELNAAITLLLNDPDYRSQLGRNASIYYASFCSPAAVIRNISKENHSSFQV